MSKVSHYILHNLKTTLKVNKAFLHEPYFSGKESKYLAKCIESGYVSYIGKYVNLFEKKISNFTNSNYVSAVVNGTVGIQLALKAINIDEGDEVFIPSLTFVATANAVKYVNASPHFVDVESEHMGIDPYKLEKYIQKECILKNNLLFNTKTKKKIKALILVHTFGHPAKIDEIKTICKKYKLKFIEDAAESLGSYYKNQHTGTFSDVGVISFNGNKIITTGGGGAIITNNLRLHKKIKHLSTTAKINHPYEYIHDEIGFNYRLPNINASVGVAQMTILRSLISKKRKLFNLYNKIFKGNEYFDLFKEPNGCKSNYWFQTIILKEKYIKDKNKILKDLNTSGFKVRPAWKPLHLLKPYLDCQKSNLSTTNDLYNKIINLPSSPSLIDNA